MVCALLWFLEFRARGYLGSRGSPSTRSPMMLRWISLRAGVDGLGPAEHEVRWSSSSAYVAARARPSTRRRLRRRARPSRARRGCGARCSRTACRCSTRGRARPFCTRLDEHPQAVVLHDLDADVRVGELLADRRARRWRRSSARPRSARRAPRWNASCCERNAVPRSKPSVAIATFQPVVDRRRRRGRASVRASSKKTSLNSAVPVICFSGRTSTPGWSIGTSRYDRPLCAVGVRVGAHHREAPLRAVRERRPHLLAVDDPLVAVEHGARLHVRQVGAGVGLRVALAPQLLDRLDLREEALLLRLGAVRDQRGREQALAEEAHTRRARSPSRTPR